MFLENCAEVQGCAKGSEFTWVGVGVGVECLGREVRDLECRGFLLGVRGLGLGYGE